MSESLDIDDWKIDEYPPGQDEELVPELSFDGILTEDDFWASCKPPPQRLDGTLDLPEAQPEPEEDDYLEELNMSF